jgi:hypothetical protein
MNAAWPSAAYVLVGTAMAFAHLHRSGLRGSRLWAYAAGFGPLAGITTASLLLFAARAVGAPPPRLTHFIVAGTVLALASVFTRPVAHGPASPSRWHARQPPLLVLGGIGVAGVAVWLTVTAFVAFTRTWPVGTWDAVAIWGSRALLFHRAYDAFPALLQQGAVTLPHYPLLVPGAVAAQYFMLGGEPGLAPALVGALAVFSVAWLVFVAVREEAGLTAALLALAFVLTSQPLWAFGFGRVADVHVAAGLLAAALGVTSHLAGSRMWPVPPLLVGYCFSMLLWSKNEGLVLAAIALAACALVALVSRAPLRPWLGIAAGAAPGLLALLEFKRAWVPESGIDSFFLAGWQAKLLVLERFVIPVRGLAARLVPGGPNYGWGSTWLALLVGIVLIVWWERRRRTPARVAWALALALTVAFWVFTYATTPYDPVWHIASSLDRLMLQVWPLAVAGVFGAMGGEAAAWRERRAGRNP